MNRFVAPIDRLVRRQPTGNNRVPQGGPGGTVAPGPYGPTAPDLIGTDGTVGQVHTLFRMDTPRNPSSHSWSPLNSWDQPDSRLPRIFNPRLRSRAALTGYGMPYVWDTLQMAPALPDLQSALSRRLMPVMQPFGNQAGSRVQVPAVFVPVRSIGPGRTQ